MAALQIKYFLISITCHVSVLLSESFQVGVLYSTSRIVLLFFCCYFVTSSWLQMLQNILCVPISLAGVKRNVNANTVWEA